MTVMQGRCKWDFDFAVEVFLFCQALMVQIKGRILAILAPL